jgi:hypothetical protein
MKEGCATVNLYISEYRADNTWKLFCLVHNIWKSPHHGLGLQGGDAAQPLRELNHFDFFSDN